MRAYHKIGFTVGYQGDAETLDFGWFEGQVGVGYQVVDVDTGSQVGLFSLSGAPLNLPKIYSFEFLEVDAPAPAWAPSEIA